MTQNGDFSCETLEERYATEHVGGAFNAKIIPKPLPVDQALKDATLGAATAETSQYLEGADFTPYIWHDDILPENKRHRFFTPAKQPSGGTGMPGKPIARVFVPTPFQPLVTPPHKLPPITWDTYPDIWDQDKTIVQIVWNQQANQSNGGYTDYIPLIPAPPGSELEVVCPCGLTPT